jgi:putative phosphoesterase
MIVSDTHKRHGNLVEAIYREGTIDKLIHLGDVEGEEDIINEIAGCEVLYVPGNNDFFSNYSKEMEIEIGKYKVLLTHGHYYYVTLDLQVIKEEAISRGMDIVMFGHTHRPLILMEEDIILINPGSISYPRQPDKKPTYIMMEIDKKGQAFFTLKTI